MNSECGDLTLLLRRLAKGDRAAGEELAPHIYSELHKIAAFYLRREMPAHSWQTTDLVNEAYLKLIGAPDMNFEGRSHFFGIAARIMRRLLTDYARRKGAEKRGGKKFLVPFDDSLAISNEQCELVEDLDDALQRLEAINPSAARVVELRFFGGLTEDETAEVIGASLRTVKRRWVMARAWLFSQMRPLPEE